MLAVETMLEDAALRIDLIQDTVRVLLMTGREDDDLPTLGNLLEESQRVGTDGYVHVHQCVLDR
jgi:hypothetical protein